MLGMFVRFAIVVMLALSCTVLMAQSARPRARDLGLAPGVLAPGPLNAITDVPGVRVGHSTLNRGDDVRTGVTAVVPHAGNVFQEKVPGAVFVGNAFGKLAGSTQVDELGTIETPIVLTNTLAVGAAIEGVVQWTLSQAGNAQVRSVNALVGETNDGGLNDIRGLHVRPEHVKSAIEAAREGAVEEGSVGAGMGTRAFAWKGGIGTSSRRLDPREGSYTLGVLVQSNYGGFLTMGGAPVWRELKPPPAKGGALLRDFIEGPGFSPADHDGSCMIIVATDAPLDARDLKRLAARAIYGLARTGSSYSNGSGDFAIAFSTAASLRVRFNESTPQTRTVLPTDGVSALFEAALEATEEAVYNSIVRATSVTSRFGSADAVPIDRLTEVLRRYRVVQ